MNGRVLADGTSGAAAMASARRQQAAMVAQQAQSEGSSNLSAAWTAVGPARIASLSYGDVTGRVTSVAIDPADATGNTVYVGTTGGGVWKSTNAAGAVSGVTFSPLTDTLPVFSANAAGASIPSLSIGAISVNSGVILAGTGDPNDATDSFYGGGIAPGLLDRVPRLQAPSLFIWGGLDKHITPDHRRAVTEALTAQKKTYVNVEFSSADHGFFCDERAAYEPRSARQAWVLTLEFLRS